MNRLTFILGLIFIGISTICSTDNFSEWKTLSESEKKQLMLDLQGTFNYSKLSFEFELRTFSTHETTTVADYEKGQSFIDGQFSKSIFMDLETFTDPNYEITINRSDKNILISNRDLENNKRSDLIWLKFITEKCQVSVLEADNQKSLRFVYPKGGEYESTIVVLDKENRITKSTVYLALAVSTNSSDTKAKKYKPRMEFSYLQFNTEPNFSSTIFDYSSIVQIEKNSAKLQPQYKTYQLIDTRIETLNKSKKN